MEQKVEKMINQEWIEKEIDSLETFLKSQAERFAKQESDEDNNEFKDTPLKNYVSGLHIDLSSIVKQVRTNFTKRIDELTNPPKEEKKSEPGTSAEVTESGINKEVVEKFVQPFVERDPNLPKQFHEMTKTEKVLKFLNDRLEALEGTGPEWDEVKDYIKEQITSLSTVDLTSDSSEEKASGKKAAKKKAAKKKVAKKAAPKKAAKKKK